MLGELFAHARSGPEAQRAFLQGIRGASWLFDEHVDRYLTKELWKRVVTLDSVAAMLDVEGAPDREAAIKKKWEIMEWVTAQDSIVDEMFGRFLKMDENFFRWLRTRLYGR